MTLVYRITIDDDLARAIFHQLHPYARIGTGKQVSNKLVRRTLSPALRAVSEAQIRAWTRDLDHLEQT